jgi:hypothetical protein
MDIYKIKNPDYAGVCLQSDKTLASSVGRLALIRLRFDA